MLHITASARTLRTNAFIFNGLRDDKGIGFGGCPGEKVGRF
jgi:hypothetical protein